MPLTRFKLSSIGDGGITNAKLADDAVNTDELADNIEISGTEAARVPVGTTAQRANAQSGDIRFNSTFNLMEYYDGSGWRAIDTAPTISSISPTSMVNTDSDVDIVITGTNFSSGLTVRAIGQDGSIINAGTVTVDSSTQITANFDGTDFSNAQEDYDIQVNAQSGLNATLEDSLSVNASPTWTTAAGNIIDDYENQTVSTTVVATDPDSDSITYSVTTGTLPTGITLNSSTGVVSGDLPAVSGSDVTTSIGITASDGSNSSERTFTIINRENDIDTGLVAWFDMDSSYVSGSTITARYSNSGTYTGTFSGSPTRTDNGPTTNVDYLSFDGVDDYVTGGQRIPFSEGGTANTFSVSMWMKFNSSGQSSVFPMDYGAGTDASSVFRWEVQSGTTDNSIEFGVNDGTVWVEALYHTNMGTGWHHVVFVKNSTQQLIYVDNSLVTTQASVSHNPIYDAGQRFMWGARNEGSGFANVSFATIRYYDRPISTTAIARLYNLDEFDA